MNVIAPIVNEQRNANINIEKKLMFTLWMLAKPESFLAISDRFDLPKSTSHDIFKDIIEILAQLIPQYVKWPNAMQCQLSCNVCC